jgi:hypothetical protein
MTVKGWRGGLPVRTFRSAFEISKVNFCHQNIPLRIVRIPQKEELDVPIADGSWSFGILSI